MENYICLNGRKVELTSEQVAELLGGVVGEGEKPLRELRDIPVGGVFKIGEYEFFVLEHSDYGTAVLLKELYVNNVKFGENNNFDGSNVDEICGEFVEVLEGIVGEDNLLLHDVDLTADDGLSDYGTVERKVSLLTADMYRRHVYTIDMHKLDSWWWLATPHSTNTHADYNWVKCVSPSGIINYDLSCSNIGGVRPFCILKSNIFVS
jgi:hypothetical protein